MNKPSATIHLTAAQKAEIRTQASAEELETTFSPLEQLELAQQFPNLSPYFRSQTEPEHESKQPEVGVKYDSDKPRMCLVTNGFPNALTEVAKVATEGAKKYGDYNWLKVENGIERYTNALDRHRLHEGITFDSINTDDFGLLNATHTAWNSLARLELILQMQRVHNGSDR